MIKEIFEILFIKASVCRQYIREKMNIINLKYLYKKVNLTKEQIDSINKIWIENYGKKISKKWHRLYTAYNGEFNQYYFPEIYFTTNLVHKLNPPLAKRYLSDKALTQYFFNGLEKGFKTIKYIIYNSNGFFYAEKRIINYDEAIEILYNIGEVVIKPSVDSNSGNGVNIINVKNGIDINSNTSIVEILKKYDKNYIIQEKIKQHPSFSKLNHSSVNTLRINTYICEGKVYASPTMIRIGRKGKIVDNACAGGLTVGIDESGNLMKYAFLKNGEKFVEHPDNHVIFEGYKIPRAIDMIEFAINNHYRIPNVGIISWDMTLDEDKNVVIIESNIRCPGLWCPQYSTGKAFFGENTEKMIKMLK